MVIPVPQYIFFLTHLIPHCVRNDTSTLGHFAAIIVLLPPMGGYLCISVAKWRQEWYTVNVPRYLTTNFLITSVVMSAVDRGTRTSRRLALGATNTRSQSLLHCNGCTCHPRATALTHAVQLQRVSHGKEIIICPA
jgi:hypothetical protein